MALIAVILLLMMMSALTAALAVSGNTETRIARNYQATAEARAAADAGVNHALEVVIDYVEGWQAASFASASAAMSALLLGPDGQNGTASTDADNGSLAELGIPLTGLKLSTAPGVTYRARLFDEDDDNRGVRLSADDIGRIGEDGDPVTDANARLVIRAIGFARGDAVATVEVTVGPVGPGGQHFAVTAWHLVQ